MTLHDWSVIPREKLLIDLFLLETVPSRTQPLMNGALILPCVNGNDGKGLRLSVTGIFSVDVGYILYTRRFANTAPCE